MRKIGANKIQVLRGVEDLKAYEAGLSNRTNAYDLLLLFEKLGKYELVDSLASIEMIDILLDQNFNEIIPAYLPDSVQVAHKTGSITKVAHDSGLILLPGNKSYALVLLSKEWDNRERANKLMAEISLMIYEFMAGSSIQ
jgi:beta-lactamase class A